MTRTLLVGLGAAAVLLAACSSDGPDVRQDALDIIATDFEPRLGLGDLDVTCAEPASTDPGMSFSCEGLTADGAKILFAATIGEGDVVAVQPANVPDDATVQDLEVEAARIVSESAGVDLTADNIDCSGQTIVIQVGKPILCALSDPSEPSIVFDVSITPADLGLSEIEVAIAEAPRT